MIDKAIEEPDYRVRRGELSAYGRAVASTKKLRLLIMGISLSTLILLGVFLYTFGPHSENAVFLLVCIALVVVAGLGLVYHFVNRHFIEPNLAFRLWLQKVCDGDLDARIGLKSTHPHYKELHFHTGNLATSLARLSDDMDNLVESQTQRLEQQNSVLELLFNLTADVASEAENTAAFVTVCEHLSKWFGSACVGCCRIVENKHVLECVAASTSGEHEAATFSVDPLTDSSRAITRDQIPPHILSTGPSESQPRARIWVPFFTGVQSVKSGTTQVEPAGVLIIEHDNPALSEHSDTKRVLTSVSDQLGVLCERKLIQRQMLQARLSKDRNELAAEIHDSLAQTLLAVRYQATLLSEKLKAHEDSATYHDVQKIKGSIEEANEEIRGLIREYRNPLAEHRTADSLQEVIDQFSQNSHIDVFFQTDDPHIRFTPREESVLQRIISEALNNARKYAQASMIRVFLQCDVLGVRRILVEDDGVGFEQQADGAGAKHRADDGGEHIGLTIMRERALSVGAKLTIDSEPGEGTRISIAMPPLIESTEHVSKSKRL